MNNIYIISDLHLGHENIWEARGFSSLQEHDEYIIDNWNTTVDKKDTIWVLGDVVMGGSHNLKVLDQLKGTKKLVMGNHDRYPSSEYLKYFSNLYGAVKVKGCILTHIPVHEDQFLRSEKYKLNIHGHLHSKIIDRKIWCTDEYVEYMVLPDFRYCNVSCEQVNYTPKLLNTILEERYSD